MSAARRAQRGFTVIELMIAIALIALLTLFAMPMYRTWLQNAQLRATAESIAAGLQHARSEAVRLNATAGVRFVFADGAWRVERVADGTVIQRGGGKDLGENAVVTVTPAANATITFGPLGQAMPTGTIADFDVTHAGAAGADTSLKCQVDGGDLRCLAVQVRGGGMVRMCDRSVTTDGDPRKCL